MKRFKSVITSAFIGFFVANLFLTIIFFIDRLFTGEDMPWEYLGYVSLYGMIVSIIFGYMDRPALEGRLHIIITICTVALFIYSVYMNNLTLTDQSIYLFFGIVVSRKMIMLIDSNLDFEESEKKNKKSN